MPIELGPHNLTSDTSRSPFVVSSSAFLGGYEPFRAFVGGVAGGQYFLLTALPGWLQLDIGTASTLGSYAFQMDAFGEGARAPKTWTMQGSNDGSTWTTLDTRASETGWGTSEIRTYICASPTTAYRYFRVTISANNGDASYTQIAELSLYPYTASVELGPHDMTSDTSHSPFVASASTVINSSWQAYMAFDGAPGYLNSGWSGSVQGPPTVDWLQIDLGSAAVLGSYAVQANGNPTTCPKTWTMQGSNDGSTWTTLDTRASETGWGSGDARTYICASPGSYRYYRLNVTANNGGQYAQVAELYLYQGAALAAQTITFPAIAGHVDTDAAFNLAATSDSGLAVSYAVTSGPATVSGNTVTLTGGPGSVTIQATQAGNGSFAAATPVNQTFAVTSAAETITFPAIPDHSLGDAPFNLAATASSGLAVSYSVVSGPATISGNTVTLTGGLGLVTIQATQVGNGTYAAATPVNQTFNVTLRAQTITFPPISSGAANDPPFVLVGSSDSGLPLSYAVTSGPATISGNVVTLTGVGSVTIQATQAGNGTYAPATPVSESFSVAPAQRGNIAYDQIKASDRTGNGNQLLTYSPVPASATSPGTPGQVAFDAVGNWYFCYGVNQWGRIGPTGYGSAAASPPSW